MSYEGRFRNITVLMLIIFILLSLFMELQFFITILDTPIGIFIASALEAVKIYSMFMYYKSRIENLNEKLNKENIRNITLIIGIILLTIGLIGVLKNASPRILAIISAVTNIIFFIYLYIKVTEIHELNIYSILMSITSIVSVFATYMFVFGMYFEKIIPINDSILKIPYLILYENKDLFLEKLMGLERQENMESDYYELLLSLIDYKKRLNSFRKNNYTDSLELYLDTIISKYIYSDSKIIIKILKDLERKNKLIQSALTDTSCSDLIVKNIYYSKNVCRKMFISRNNPGTKLYKDFEYAKILWYNIFNDVNEMLKTYLNYKINYTIYNGLFNDDTITRFTNNISSIDFRFIVDNYINSGFDATSEILRLGRGPVFKIKDSVYENYSGDFDKRKNKLMKSNKYLEHYIDSLTSILRFKSFELLVKKIPYKDIKPHDIVIYTGDKSYINYGIQVVSLTFLGEAFLRFKFVLIMLWIMATFTTIVIEIFYHGLMRSYFEEVKGKEKRTRKK